MFDQIESVPLSVTAVVQASPVGGVSGNGNDVFCGVLLRVLLSSDVVKSARDTVNDSW